MKKSLGAVGLIYPLPVLVIGTYNADMEPNVMTAAFGGVVSAMPATVSVSIRKVTLTYENIMRNKEFTINIPSEDTIKEADYFGAVGGRDTSKFVDTGLTATKGTFVNAPYVEEFPANMECRLLQVNETGSHIQLIAEVLDAKINEDMLNENGIQDLNRLKPVSFLAFQYFGLGDTLGKAFSLGKEFKPDRDIEYFDLESNMGKAMSSGKGFTPAKEMK
jgi:flavin reductase (DIM6/NTAB) family NADH-FMN oxidoreductase RutF